MTHKFARTGVVTYMEIESFLEVLQTLAYAAS
jgi:hypothetical protein